jgi:hypothetical protein
MRRRLPRFFAAAAVTTGVVLTGCSSGGDDAPQPSASQPSSQATTPATTPARSPGGVTTAVGAAAESTEEEDFQACNAARLWMTERGGDLKAQLEPYLAEVQRSDSAGPGTFGTPWSQLAPARQSAVIVAAEAAADELCG